MSDIIEIGTAKANPGTISEGNIIVEKLAGGGDISMPVTIINGKKSGPCFWINGGIHGDEPEGILTCSLLKKVINPSASSSFESDTLLVGPKRVAVLHLVLLTVPATFGVTL